MDDARAIGVDGGLPWNLPEDLKRFSSLTTGHAVLMGRNTYDSLPPKFRPLPNRKNIVVTRDPRSASFPKDVEVWTSPVECIRAFISGTLQTPSDKLWIIGGEQVFRATQPYWTELYLTVIHSINRGDAFFPEFEKDFTLAEDERRDGFSFRRYVRSRIGALSSAG